MHPTHEDLKSMQTLLANQNLIERAKTFKEFSSTQSFSYMRKIVSKTDREVSVEDPITGKIQQMLMFASNNYLGLATHPKITEYVKICMDKYGVGIGGPPLLNGYLKLTEELEDRLASFKSKPSAMVFSSGFLANLAVISGVASGDDVVIFDQLSHASLFDALKLTKSPHEEFLHNDMTSLERLLEKYQSIGKRNIYVCVEGVYSMDGDISPLPQIVSLCRTYGALLILDDAHGAGVLGENGKGTASHFNVEEEIDIDMGTFSKVFATCGGYLASSEDIINYLRFNSRQYIFSASIPPAVMATVLGGLKVLEDEPWRRISLAENMKYAIEKLENFEFCAKPEGGIITLRIPEGMNIRAASYMLHRKNIFINPIEFPAVPLNHERFRISFMAHHTKEDIDRLATALEEVWHDSKAFIF